MALSSTMLSSLRQCFIDNIDHAQFKVGSSYTNAALVEKMITRSGNVKVSFYINAAGGSTVTECRLLDASNHVLVSKAESITMLANAAAVYYFFAFNVYEQT